MEQTATRPNKAVILSGKRTDSPYSVRIQIVQHPDDHDIRRSFSTHSYPFTDNCESLCLATYERRCPVCDLIALDGEPIPKWRIAAKNYVMFYGVCLSEGFLRDQTPVAVNELTLWLMLKSDFKFMDQILTQRRFTANRMSSYIFDIFINPQADFSKFQRRCTSSLIDEVTAGTHLMFGSEAPPLGTLYYKTGQPSESDVENLFKAYCRLPLKPKPIGVRS